MPCWSRFLTCQMASACSQAHLNLGASSCSLAATQNHPRLTQGHSLSRTQQAGCQRSNLQPVLGGAGLPGSLCQLLSQAHLQQLHLLLRLLTQEALPERDLRQLQLLGTQARWSPSRQSMTQPLGTKHRRWGPRWLLLMLSQAAGRQAKQMDQLVLRCQGCQPQQQCRMLRHQRQTWSNKVQQLVGMPGRWSQRQAQAGRLQTLSGAEVVGRLQPLTRHRLRQT